MAMRQLTVAVASLAVVTSGWIEYAAAQASTDTAASDNQTACTEATVVGFPDAFLCIFQRGEFYQQALVWLLTAGFGGLIFGVAKSVLDRRATRYDNLFSKKLEFLEKFSDNLWDFHFAVIKVSHMKAEGRAEGQEYDSALKEYNAAAWKTLEELRKLQSRAEQFPERDARRRLRAIYDQLLNDELTIRIELQSGRYRGTGEPIGWSKWHNDLHARVWPGQIDDQIREVAEALGLHGH